MDISLTFLLRRPQHHGSRHLLQREHPLPPEKKTLVGIGVW